MTVAEEWLTTQQVAHRLGLSSCTVRLAIAEGRLPAGRFGSRHAVHVSAVARYAQEHLRNLGRPTCSCDHAKTTHTPECGACPCRVFNRRPAVAA